VKFGNYFLACVCILFTAGITSAQTANVAEPQDEATPKSPTPLQKAKPNAVPSLQDALSRVLKNPSKQMELPKVTEEESDSPYVKGKIRYLSLRHAPADVHANLNASGIAAGTNAQEAELSATSTATLTPSVMPTFRRSFKFLGAEFPFEMIGTDPAKGSAVTKVPVKIIPVRANFGDGIELSASQTACGDTQSPISRTLKSPLFQNFPFRVGNTFVGNTQYIDAFQRANFWTDVKTKAPNYHVLLSPSLSGTFTITPNPETSAALVGPCTFLAVIDLPEFDQQAQNLIKTLNVPQGTLPLFVTYNTVFTLGGSCCVLGYHSVTFNSLEHPYAVAAYVDAGTFTKPIEDIHTLTHELGEWLDDPVIRSLVPSWGNVGQVQGGCSLNLEVGDAVTGVAFEVTMNGFTYHPEDLTFLPFFSRETPSSSVNGQYSFLNSFASAPPICGQ